MAGDDILHGTKDLELSVGGTSEAALFKNNDKKDENTTHADCEINPANPWNWHASRKWLLLALSCFVTCIVGLNATASTAAVEETNLYFGISDRNFPNSVWPVTVWNTGAAIAPMLILPIMEEHGIRLGYIATYLLFLTFVVPQAIARNFATIVATRFVAGCCAGILQDSMDGIIADLWREAEERSFPVSCYVVSLLVGISLGPVMGGAIMAGGLGWRWIFYIQLIIYGAIAPFVLLCFRETRLSVILKKTQKKGHRSIAIIDVTESPNLQQHNRFDQFIGFLKGNVIRPSYFLCTEPVVFFFTLLSALSYGVVYISTQSVTQVYQNLYSFDQPRTGLIQGSIVFGEVVGFFFCVIIQDRFFAHKAAASRRHRNPDLAEVRLYLAIPASFIGISGGLFWYGWTSYSWISFYVPTVGLFFIGFGTMVVMQAIMVYITDSYAKYAASASAAICFGENIFAGWLPLASQSMYTNLGFRWASSLLGFLALTLSFAPVVLVWKGRRIRERSPFMREAMYGS